MADLHETDRRTSTFVMTVIVLSFMVLVPAIGTVVVTPNKLPPFIVLVAGGLGQPFLVWRKRQTVGLSLLLVGLQLSAVWWLAKG